MASYIVNFTSTSGNLSTWKVINLTDTEGGYVNPATGHQEIDISGYDASSGNIVRLGIAWADCDTSKNNAIIGVTKYREFDLSTGTRRTELDDSSGGWVYETIEDASTADKMPIAVNGIGTCIDLRSNPQTGIRRIMLVGLIYEDLGSINSTIIITPTRIAS
jgi:hypothetical protein